MRPDSKSIALLLGLLAACCAPLLTGTLRARYTGYDRYRLLDAEKDVLRQEALSKGCVQGGRSEPTFDDCQSIATELRDGWYVLEGQDLSKWLLANLAVAGLALATVVLVIRRGPRAVDACTRRLRA